MLNVTRTLKTKLANTAARFKRDEAGNFAIMAAVSLGILVAGLAVSVDASNSYFAKQRLQDTTDAIALMAAKGKIETQAELDAAANEYLQMTYPGSEGIHISLESITREGDLVTVAATNKIPTYFTGIFGKAGMDIGAASQALYSSRNLDIALVLDTTFSMNGSKMTNLKSAANNLVDTFGDFQSDSLRVSVVPFAQYVNVGMSRRNANWLDVPADQVHNYMKRDVISRTNCRNVPNTGSRDGVPVGGTRQECDVVRGPEYAASWTATWRGCVGSRLTPGHERVDFGGNRIPGILNSQGRCGTEIRPLTANMNQVKQTINAMNADGNTYIPAGLAWGWRALDNREPLTEAASLPAGDTDKVMVIMTDGDNFKSKDGILHKLNDAGDGADITTRRLCDRIKNDEIKVFTIAYEVTDTTTQNLLRNCATNPGSFFNATNAQQLNEAFEAIGNSLIELRVTA
ncbi:MAG: TadE/TadG family type IV pilus assembly protein [Hellea sp.]